MIMCLFALPLTVDAQKVIDRSAKKRPAWVGATEEGYLIVSATDKDIEAAKQKSLVSVKVQILESVAQNIEHTTETLIEQITRGDDVQSNIDFRQRGRTRVANLPFISGVTLSNAADSYWEQIEDKASGDTYYMFSLLYPYSSSDYTRLKSEFDKLDGEMVATVKRLEGKLSSIDSVAAIGRALDELTMAHDYFFDSKRQAWTENVSNAYRNVYRSLTVESKRMSSNSFKCRITYEGKAMACSTMPKMRSECATQLNCTNDGTSYTVTFSDQDCIADEDNYIELSFRLDGNHTLRHKLHIGQ